VFANVDVYDSSARALTNAAGAIVISVKYRQAPENPFPAVVEDAYASYIWATQNAATINGDPKRVAVAGESAGGNLATVVARRARDNGDQLPVHQLLVYPITNYNFDTPSYNQYANAKPLSKGLMQWFFRYYLPSEADGASPDVSPLRADLSGLPPATIIAAQIDPLQSEGQQYAQQLRDAGVPVTYQLYTGVTHEFFGTGAVVDKGKQAVALAGNQLRMAFGLPMLPSTGANDLPRGTGLVLAGVLVALGGALVVRTRKAQAARM
jgi:acetyl esterase/lipase